MAESSGSVPIQGISQIITQPVPRSLSTSEISQYIDNHQSYVTAQPPPDKPPSGSIILYDKTVVDQFRRDGYEWEPENHNPRKDKDNHLQGYYARGVPNANFQRRLYWTRDGNAPNSNIVVVHYLEVQPVQRRRSTKIKKAAEYGNGLVEDNKRRKVTEFENESSSGTNSSHQTNGIASWVHHPQLVHHTSISDTILDQLDRQLFQRDLATEPSSGIPQSKDIRPSSGTLNHQADTGSVIPLVEADLQFDNSGFDGSGTGPDYQQNFNNEETEPIPWINNQANTESSFLSAGPQLSDSHFGDNIQEQDSRTNDVRLNCFPRDTGSYDPLTESFNFLIPESPAGSNDIICTIEDFAPEWGYEYTHTKVLITGTFASINQPGENCEWYCVFGEDKVRAEYRFTSLRCHTPLRKAGKVTFYVETLHGSVRSELKEFEFRAPQKQGIGYSSIYSNDEVFQVRSNDVPRSSITPRTIDPAQQQRMSEIVDQTEFVRKAVPDVDIHYIDTM